MTGIGEIVYVLSKYFIYFALLVLSLYGTYAVYYAYIKTKDERQKYIVLQSVAKAFFIVLILFFIYYLVQLSVKVADIKYLSYLWKLLHFTSAGFSAGLAVSWMMSILGISLFINKKKAGGE